MDKATLVNGQVVLFGQVFHSALAYFALDFILVIQLVTDSVVYPGRVQMRVAFQDLFNGIAGFVEASDQRHSDPCAANDGPPSSCSRNAGDVGMFSAHPSSPRILTGASSAA